MRPLVAPARRRPLPGGPPAIAPIASGVDRPFWSVMIPTRDSGPLLAASLESVLAEDPGPSVMQIEVIDDASTHDDPTALVREMAGDRVAVVRHHRNLGAPATFNEAIRRARGHWVHVLHADDVVRPGFYSTYRATIERGDWAMVVGPTLRIDADGDVRGQSPRLTRHGDRLADPWDALAVRHAVDFPAVVVARATYERVGGFRADLVHANDWELWTRIAASGAVGAVGDPLAGYRRHDRSDTSRLERSSTYLLDPLDALELIAARAPSADAERRLREANLQVLAVRSRSVARRHARAGAVRPAITSATWSVRIDPSVRGIAGAARTVAIAAWTATKTSDRSNGSRGSDGSGP